MVITREIRDEMKSAVSNSITLILKEQEFLQPLAEKVAASVTKSLEGKLAELEKIILNNSTVIKELKEETAMLQMENKVLTQRLNEFDQVGKLGNLRIFQLEETPQENLTTKGSGIVIKEDLTENRSKLLEAAIEKTLLKSVWTYNGRVCVLKENKKVFINDTDDLNKI
nr:unnamed protein product [Callosobruchus analis]